MFDLLAQRGDVDDLVGCGAGGLGAEVVESRVDRDREFFSEGLGPHPHRSRVDVDAGDATTGDRRHRDAPIGGFTDAFDLFGGLPVGRRLLALPHRLQGLVRVAQHPFQLVHGKTRHECPFRGRSHAEKSITVQNPVAC